MAVDMAAESAEPIERWTAKRRVALVIRILKGETSVTEAARQQGLTVAEIEDWREKFLLGGRERAADEAEGRRGAAAQAAQAAQAEDWRARTRQ